MVEQHIHVFRMCVNLWTEFPSVPSNYLELSSNHTLKFFDMKVLEFFKAIIVYLKTNLLVIWLHLAIISLDCQFNASSPN